MADADWVKTAKLGLKLAFAAFLLPFLFALDPSLILIGPLWQTGISFSKGLIAIVLLSSGFMGYMRVELGVLMRAVVIAAGICFLGPQWWLNLIGGALAVWVWLSQKTDQ